MPRETEPDWLPMTPVGEPTMFTELEQGELRVLWETLRRAHDLLNELPDDKRQPVFSEVVTVWWDVATEIDKRDGE